MNNLPIAIIPFTEAHQPGIDNMLQEITTEYEQSFFSPGAKKICDLYTLSGRQYWVAIAGGVVVGSVGVILCDGEYAVLKSMFLRKAFRNTPQQIANRLLATAILFATQKQYPQMYLGTMEQFAAAQRFYEKCGFTKTHKNEMPENFPANEVDTVFYRKDISNYNF